MFSKNKNFNAVIVGTGGQGQITLLKILVLAAEREKLGVKTSELHGLAQKGGSVEVHFRCGQKLFSPLVPEGGADLVIALERQEALRACYYASRESKTLFLVNDFVLPIPGQPILGREAIKPTLKKFSQKTIFVPATEICRREFQAGIGAGVFLLAWAAFNSFLPLGRQSLKESLEESVKSRYRKLNLAIFELAGKQTNFWDQKTKTKN